jgi:hypothetical protein
MTHRPGGLLVGHIEAGTIPGAVAVLASSDDVEVVAAGVASVDGEPMHDDAIMRIQSMTKVITAVAALRLVEAGRLRSGRCCGGVVAGTGQPPGARHAHGGAGRHRAGSAAHHLAPSPDQHLRIRDGAH